MSLLPPNEPAQLKAIDAALGGRYGALDTRNLSNLPRIVEAKYLPILAASYDVDISFLSEEEARSLLEAALFLKGYAGTAFSLKKAIGAIFDDVVIDDGVGGHQFDAHVTAKGDLHAEKIARIKALANRYKNVRSRLRNFVISIPQIEVTHYAFPACIFDVEVGGDALFAPDATSTIGVGVGASMRVQFDVSARVGSMESSIINEGGMTWRL